jgi:protein-tyrosine-phosphatase
MPFPYKSILVACSVNTARSRMAEGYLKYYLSDDIEIKSCGVASNARDGMLISLDAKLVMKEENIMLSNDSKSKDLKKHIDLLENVELVLTLTNKHKESVQNLIESHKLEEIEVMTLKEFAGRKGDIEDPSMKGIEGFRKARDEIKSCILDGLNRFKIK